MSEEIPLPDGLGLDKAARNALQRSRKEKSEDVPADPQLEPSFPYTIVPLDLTFFDT